MKIAIEAVLMTALVVAGQNFAGDPAVADEKETYSVSQEAWSAGTQSGEGNFLGNCLPCHGMEGKGDGPLAESLGGDVRPSDLSDATRLMTRTDEFLFDVIKNGGKSVGLSESMPDWGATFNDEAIRNLVQFIRVGLCRCPIEGGGAAN